MSDSAWVLKGIDPETRARAVEEAERLGVSLADYLTDQVLRAAITDQIVSSAPAEDFPALAETTEPGVRHRFRTLERRLENALGSLDGAQRTLDASFFDISERIDELEGFASGTAPRIADASRSRAWPGRRSQLGHARTARVSAHSLRLGQSLYDDQANRAARRRRQGEARFRPGRGSGAGSTANRRGDLAQLVGHATCGTKFRAQSRRGQAGQQEARPALW